MPRDASMIVRSLVAIALTFVLVTGTPSPASADTLSFKDKTGDAVPRFDLTKIRIANGEDQFAVSARLRDLRGGGTQIFGFSLTPAQESATYSLQTVRRRNGTVTSKLFRTDQDGQVQVPCKVHARWSLSKDVVATRFPQGCLAHAGRANVSVFVGEGNGSAGDPVDWTRTVRVAQG